MAESVTNPEPEPLLSPKEAAAMLGVSEAHLRRLRKRGGGPPHIAVSERVIRYQPADLRAWIEARKATQAEGVGSGLE